MKYLSRIAHILAQLAIVGLVGYIVFLKCIDWTNSDIASEKQFFHTYRGLNEQLEQKQLKQLKTQVEKRVDYKMVFDTMKNKVHQYSEPLDNAEFASNYQNIWEAYWEGQPPMVIVNGAPVFREKEIAEMPKPLADSLFSEAEVATFPEELNMLGKLHFLNSHLIYKSKLRSKVGTTNMHEGYYFMPTISNRNFPLVGEPYKADIFLTFFGGSPKTAIRYFCNGDSLGIKDGKCLFRSVFKEKGTQKLNFRAEYDVELLDGIHTFVKEKTIEVYVE